MKLLAINEHRNVHKRNFNSLDEIIQFIGADEKEDVVKIKFANRDLNGVFILLADAFAMRKYKNINDMATMLSGNKIFGNAIVAKIGINGQGIVAMRDKDFDYIEEVMEDYRFKIEREKIFA